jgi:D-alanine-D-alanine ligase
MKIAIVYNRDSKRVINLFGMPNQEKYGLKSIKRITDALESGGHQVIALEGDKDLIENLEEFMPQVVKGERPGMVFNLSYGIQGQARYTHVPGMLEMIGLPYVGSGPLAHSLSLDKVVSKMIFRQHGISTPDFAVLEEPGFEMPDLKYPLIVKPKNEAVSFGIKIVNNDEELREGANAIFEKFSQPVLAEAYIEGREINVGLLGNSPPEVLPCAELVFGKGGPNIYTYEDKIRKSGREIGYECPANLTPEQKEKAHHLARRAFAVLGCFDCARVDMRMDKNGELYILEVNSLPSLAEHGSYVEGAKHAGLDFAGLVNRLVEVASARYFGTPSPPDLTSQRRTPGEKIFSLITQRRDDMEKHVQRWTRRRSHTSDPVGLKAAAKEVDDEYREIGLKPVDELTDKRVVWTWQTPAGLKDGTLLIHHIDVPHQPSADMQMFRRDPEWLHGEGVGSSRAPLTCVQFALRALRHARRLRKAPIGVLCYADEGRDGRYSNEIVEKAASMAKNVLVMRPGNLGDQIVVARRGQRRYRLTVEGKPVRLGKSTQSTEVLRWLFAKIEACAKLSSRKERIAVSPLEVSASHLPMLLPHKATIMLLVTYPDTPTANRVEAEIRTILKDKKVKWELELISDRPAMKERRANTRLLKSLEEVAAEWEIPLSRETSVWPSAAGLAPTSTSVVCGMGPVAKDLYTLNEAVSRTSLVQRTLLLAQFLNKSF